MEHYVIKMFDRMHVLGLSETQDELKCWRKGFIVCGKAPLLVTRMQVSEGPSCLFYLIFPIPIGASLKRICFPLIYSFLK